MTTKTINYELYRYEQEEQRETRQVVGEDGVVVEESILTQPHLLITNELSITFEEYPEDNYTKLKYRIRYSITTNTEDIEEKKYSISANNYRAATQKPYIKIVDEFEQEKGGSLTTDTERLYATPGKTMTQVFYVGSETYKTLHTYYHKLNGERNLIFNVKSSFIAYGIEALTKSAYVTTKAIEVPLFYDRSTTPITADNFTDEYIPSFTYQTVVGDSFYKYVMADGDIFYNTREDSIVGLQAALSFDGITPDIVYRDIPIDGTSYSFEFTDEEREVLRIKAQGSDSVPIYYLTKTTRAVLPYGATEAQTVELIGKVQRVLTIVGCEPVITPTVKDINACTVYLTGDENKFVRYKSIAEFAINPVASKHAEIISTQVINGTHTVNDLLSGTIEEVDSNTFYFSATDSRNLTAREALVRDLVPYVKLTARISEAKLDTEGTLTFTVTGNYFNGSFGAVNNSLQFEYSLIENNGDINWYIVEPEPTFNGNSYTVSYSISGLNYQNKYTISANIIDEVMSAQTEEKVISSIPVYDWSETDFNHNTKVNFKEDIEIADNKNIIGKNLKINGFSLGNSKVLWQGASHMNGNQSITLSEPVSAQTNGIMLVFSLYRNGAAEDVSINSFFVSKREVELLGNSPHSFFMLINAGFSTIGAKYLYIDDETIEGHEGNTSSSANSGITFNNSMFVLRYVIGL